MYNIFIYICLFQYIYQYIYTYEYRSTPHACTHAHTHTHTRTNSDAIYRQLHCCATHWGRGRAVQRSRSRATAHFSFMPSATRLPPTALQLPPPHPPLQLVLRNHIRKHILSSKKGRASAATFCS